MTVLKVWNGTSWETVSGGSGGSAIVCTYATRPAATAAKGWLAILSDELLDPYKLQYSDGIKWIVVATGEPAGSSSTIALLTRASDGDTNGLIYWLGTRAGAFATPVPVVAAGATVADGTDLKITTSTTNNQANYTIDRVVDRAANFAWSSGNAISSWLMLDLKTRKLLPNGFSMRSRDDGGGLPMPVGFVVEGSDDGLGFDSPFLNVSNAGFTGGSQWKSFSFASAVRPYRYLRIRNTTNDTVGSSAYMGFGEIEFYGALRS